MNAAAILSRAFAEVHDPDLLLRELSAMSVDEFNQWLVPTHTPSFSKPPPKGKDISAGQRIGWFDAERDRHDLVGG